MSGIVIANKSYPPNEVIVQSEKAAQWFIIIAGFSLLNSILVYMGAEVNFVVGLGVTMLVDGVLLVSQGELSGLARILIQTIAIGFNVGVLVFFWIIWKKSKRGSRGAYLFGMIIYLLDSLLFLMVGDWVGVGFHLFFLFFIFGGYGFIKHRRVAEALLSESRQTEFNDVTAKTDANKF